jgi:hypothetical protein
MIAVACNVCGLSIPPVSTAVLTMNVGESMPGSTTTPKVAEIVTLALTVPDQVMPTTSVIVPALAQALPGT